MKMDSQIEAPKVAIVGAGIAGCATAYFLSLSTVNTGPITILDQVEPAAG